MDNCFVNRRGTVSSAVAHTVRSCRLVLLYCILCSDM